MQWKGYGQRCYTMQRLWSLVLHNAKVIVIGVTKHKGYGHWYYKMERLWSLVLQNTRVMVTGVTK